MPERTDIQDAEPGEESLQVILGALTQEAGTLSWPTSSEPSSTETRPEISVASLRWDESPEPALADESPEPAVFAETANLADASPQVTATSSVAHASVEADPASTDGGPGASIEEAARRTGAGRVVYASSNRVTGFYPRNTTVDADMPIRPDGFYGVSKVAGEALGRLYSDKFGLQVASLRIGTFEPTPGDERQLSTWLSPSDCEQAFLAAMSAPGLTYSAIYAVSRNSRRWWDLSAGEAIGLDPQDDAERYAADVRAAAQSEVAGPQGGHYASPEYSLDRQH